VRAALAQVLLTEGHYEEAIKLADWDLKHNPHQELALRVLADAYFRLNRYEKAMPYKQLAFAHSPLQPGAARDYAFILYWQGDYEQALNPALTEICLQPEKCMQPESAWMVTLLEKVRPDYLAKMIGDVSSQMHASPQVHFALGDLLDRANLRHLAIEQYRYASTAGPYAALALFRLGADHELSDKNYAKALSAYQEAHAKDPNNPEIAAHLSRLENRLKLRRSDLCWSLKDWIATLAQPQNK
jgi:tetratricopeptide (TPR) repeat protein